LKLKHKIKNEWQVVHNRIWSR